MTEPYLNASLLVIDDNQHILKMIKRIYDRVGFMNCQYVDSAIKALELTEKFYFDLIVTDLSMPGMHGIDFIKAIKASHGVIRDTKIFVITANAEEREIEESYNLQLDGFMSKPFDGKQFYEKTKSILVTDTRTQMAG